MLAIRSGYRSVVFHVHPSSTVHHFFLHLDYFCYCNKQRHSLEINSSALKQHDGDSVFSLSQQRKTMRERCSQAKILLKMSLLNVVFLSLLLPGSHRSSTNKLKALREHKTLPRISPLRLKSVHLIYLDPDPFPPPISHLSLPVDRKTGINPHLRVVKPKVHYAGGVLND